MKSLREKILSVVSVLCGLMLIIGPYSIFRVCDSGEKIMRCTYSSRIIVCIGILVIINQFISLVGKRKNYVPYINTFLLSIFAILVPSNLIGGCEMKTMRCQVTSFPMVYVVSVILLLCSIIQLLNSRKE